MTPPAAVPSAPPERLDLLGSPRLDASTDLAAPDLGAASTLVPDDAGELTGLIGVLNGWTPLFLVAFLVALLSTPVVRRVAIAAGVIDRPDAGRKQHPIPVAYLGGVAVFLGLLAGILASLFVADIPASMRGVPIGVVLGMFAIAITGLADDVWGWDPRLKLAGQLFAAAALAHEQVGRYVAVGLLSPLLGHPAETDVLFHLLGVEFLAQDLYTWVGTAATAVFVLGGCNAANLIDGMDGLLSGTVAITALGLLAIGLLMIDFSQDWAPTDPVEARILGARITLCVVLLGATLGFLPHNFNPATIFLGDCGSLLLGFVCVVVILMLGQAGQTHYVFAGLIVFALPIIDTTLAIIRRKLAGQPMSVGDDQHIHHQIKRMVGGVKRAVFVLYGISIVFAATGVTLAGLVARTGVRVRFVYGFAIVLFGFIGVIAVKAARRRQIEKAVAERLTRSGGG